MTVQEIQNKLVNDFSFLVRVIVENNSFAINRKLEKYGYEYLKSNESAISVIIKMKEAGKLDEVADILNVPFVQGVSDPKVEAAIYNLTLQKMKIEGQELPNNDNRAFDPVSLIAGAVNSIFTTVSTVSNNHNIGSGSASQQYYSQLNQAQTAGSKNYIWIIVLLVLVALVFLYFIFIKKSS